MAEAYVAQMPRSPFQMRPIENPFRRVLPAVERFRDRVVTEVRDAGRSLNDRLHRQHALPADQGRRAQIDTKQLARARSTILQQTQNDTVRRSEAISKPHSAKQTIVHGVAEASKNAAPAMIVGAGARLVLGAGLGLQTLAVASGASAVSRGVREATFTIRKGTFGETTKLITKHEEGAKLTNFDGSERQSHTGIRAKQDQFAQTRVGKVVNAMLHGGEKKIAQFAYGKHRHAKALMQARTRDIRTLSDRELIALREHAVMARMTHGTADKVYEMRQLAKSTYQAVNRELADRGISRYEAHERQLKLYKKDVRVGAVVNVVGQAGLAALKALPKTVATFFITDAFLKAINVDTSNRHNPLEGFENTRLGQFIEHAIAPKSVAHAEAMMGDISQNASPSAIADQTTEAQRFGSSWMTHRDDLRQSVAHDPRLTTTVRVENDETIIESRGVLASEAPKPVMPAPVEAPREPSFVRAPVADRVAIAQEVNATVPMREVARTVQEVKKYTIDGKVSWTQDIFDRKLLPGMDAVENSMDWYGAPGTAERMVKEVFAVNPDLMDASDMQKMQEYLTAHPEASFVQMWKDLQHSVFANDMDTWTMGTEYTVAVDHVVTSQEAVAVARLGGLEDGQEMGGSKPPGFAKYVPRVTTQSPQYQTDGPGILLTPTQGTGADISHYQVVRPPQGSSSFGVTNSTQSMYQQVALPGGRSAPSGTVNGFQQVRRPGEIMSNSSTTNAQVVASPHNGIVPPPHQIGSPDTGMSVSNAINGYQQVAPPGSNSAISNNSAVGTYKEVGQPSAPRPVVVARPANESFQIVSPPKPQEDVSFQVVSLPRAVLPYEVSSDIRTASIVGPFDLSSGNSHVAYLESTNSHFPSSSSMPISMLNDRAPAIGAGAYEFNALGGTNIWTHTSSFKEGGKQWLEDARVYMQGGNGQPRLGPVQQLHRAQELLQSAPHLFINIDNQHQGGFSLTGVNHLLLNSDGSLDLSSTDGIIGGGSDTLSFIGCSYGHVQAIQMIIDHASEAPSHLSQWFAILNDPNASGPNVEHAVNQIVKHWFQDTPYYSDFYQLYGYLQEEIPTPGTSEYTTFLNNLANNGYMSSGRLEFEFTTGGQ